MSYRPTGANGKRNQAWGTTSTCPECGQCLCFGCHPHGPCVDESHRHSSSSYSEEMSASPDRGASGWTCEPVQSPSIAGFQLRSRGVPNGGIQ